MRQQVWNSVAAILLMLTMADFLFVPYQSYDPFFGDVNCGSGLRVLNNQNDDCGEHQGVVLIRLLVGGGLVYAALMLAERAKPPSPPLTQP